MITLHTLKMYTEFKKIFGGFLLFTLCGLSLQAQNSDSLAITDVGIQADSIINAALKEGHSPKRAMIYSIVLPGLGQAYNKKYFKIPIVYAALGTAGYMIYYNTLKYSEASDNYLDDPSTTNERYVQGYRRNLELSYIGLVLVDALAVVDAYVDAHLFYWDVDPDLSIRMEPSIQPMLNSSGTIVNNYGFRCRLTF